MNADEFNQWYEIGHPVIVTRDDDSEFHTNTRSEAWELGHGDSVVMVDGISGGYSLDRIRPLETHKS